MSTTAQRYGVCVRNSAGENRDFTPVSNVSLPPYPRTLTTAAKFVVGRYKFFSGVLPNNRWWAGTALTFTVAATVTSPVMATPTAAAPTNASAMPVGNLPNWTQNYSEDFTTAAARGSVDAVYGSPMAGYNGFSDTSGHGTYDPGSVLSVSNGALDYYLHTENGRPRVAAPVLNNYAGQTYGRYSVRFRSDKLPGYKIAFLLWPETDDWNEGEIDWPEGNLGDRMSPASAIKGSYSNGSVKFDPPNRVYSATDSTGWHIATTEWTPGGVQWFWDGQLVGSTTQPAGVPDTDFRWVLQAETALDGSTPSADTAGHLQVDWAVSYAYSPNQ